MTELGASSADGSSGLPAGYGRGTREAWPVVRSVLAVAVADAGLLALYALTPLTPAADGHVLLRSVGALLLFAVLVLWQVHAITQAQRPHLRAAVAIGFLFAAYLLGWAAAYVLHSAADPAAFTEPLDRIDALYFAVTVFATVGFGDLVPLTQSARGTVTAQMLLNLVMLGAVLRLIVTTAHERRRRLGGG